MASWILRAGGLLVAASLALRCGDPPSAAIRSSILLKRMPGHLRLSESRLTGDLQAPFRPEGSRFLPNPRDLQEISRAAEEIESRDPAPDSLRALGILRLAEGRFRDAILTLEEVALRSPTTAASLSDLAAAYLTRGQREGQSFDFVLALSAADQALAVEPDLPEALFNRAEALTHLQLPGQAGEAWDAYERVDRGSGWAAEARRHRQEFDEPSFKTVWKRERIRLEGALLRNDSGTIAEIASQFPGATRQWTEEELLPAWGSGKRLPQGLDPLDAARQLGAALRDRAGEAIVADSVAVILRAQAQGNEAQLSNLRRGHLVFRQALDLYRKQDLKPARALLLSAGEALTAAGSPFAAWTDLYIAICDSFRSREPAFRRLLRLAGADFASRYPAVAGRAEWMLGTLEAYSNRPEDSLLRSLSAVGHLARSSGSADLGVVYTQIAAAYRNLGQPNRSWEARLAALAALRRAGEPLRLHPALYETAEDLLDQGHASPALAFADECLNNALTWQNPIALAESRLLRGRALASLDRLGEAMIELRAGRRESGRIPDVDIRQRVLSAIDLAEGDLLADHDPGEAVRFFGRALAARLEKGYLYRLPVLLAGRARASRSLGDLAQEEADLRLAIDEHERIREGVRNEPFRLSSFEQVQSVFDRMVQLQVDHHGDVWEALSFAERARSRLLLDLVASPTATPGAAEGLPRHPRALPAATILARLPLGVTLVEYLVLPDRLLAWIVRRGSIELVQTEVGKEELERAVGSLRAAIERRATVGDIQRAAAPLYDWLIRPLANQWEAGSPLVFVPDRSLARIPFAALFDADRGRYLIEDHAIGLAPSATLYLAALEERSRLAQGTADALVVGDPAFDSQRYSTLPRLRAANAEAMEIAALYPRSELLRGERATRGAFLKGAPGHRIVHFAGHALLHPASPQLSSLLFAPEANGSGVLYARDLSGYRLTGTELVVLSACRTLDGAAASRENLVGLAAAFLAAGPPVVVSSLWKVDDRATRELMLAFHRALRRGNDPAVALQEAQRQLLSEPAGPFRSPGAWAGFEAFGGVLLQGN